MFELIRGELASVMGLCGVTSAAAVWATVDVERLVELLTPLSQACATHLPAANPIGLRPPSTT